MDLTGIISISGKSGLYKVVGQSKNTLIVESLEDGKKFPAHSSNKVSSLGDISFYTVEEDVSLKDVFASIFDNLDGKKAIDHKSSPEELKAFMEKVYPNYDKERVYNSDLKKLVQWYNSLLEAGIFKKEDTPSEETKTEENATTENTSEA
ncbi:MAG: DUF5606 domain-containing protein [Bacteroidia bacterium]